MIDQAGIRMAQGSTLACERISGNFLLSILLLPLLQAPGGAGWCLAARGLDCSP